MTTTPIPFLPKPQDLGKISKEDAVAVSLRMKPSTKKFYEGIASQDKGTSLNNILNAVLDSYATYYQGPVRISEQICDYLYKMAERVAHLDDEDLLVRIYNRPCMKISRFDGAPIAYANAIAELDALKYDIPGAEIKATTIVPPKEDQDDSEDENSFGYLHMMEIVCTNKLPKGAKAIYYAKENKFEKNSLEYYQYRDIDVAPEYWTVVVAMANAYLRKLKELVPDFQAVMTNSFAETLVGAINDAKDREDLAKRLAEAFTFFVEVTIDE